MFQALLYYRSKLFIEKVFIESKSKEYFSASSSITLVESCASMGIIVL